MRISSLFRLALFAMLLVSMQAAFAKDKPEKGPNNGHRGYSQRPAGPPVTLEISAPNKVGKRGVLLDALWDLTFKLRVKRAVGVFGPARSFSEDLILVVRDPDDCLDLRDYFGGDIPFEEGCSPANETWIPFRADAHDAPGVFDVPPDQECTSSSAPPPEIHNLVDDPFDSGQAALGRLNRGYLNTDPSGNIVPVGPNTGGDFEGDCFGYGADDDLPGLVVLANVSGARVFDENFETVPGKIRNLAGHLSSVGVELADQTLAATIVARMRVDNTFEPITLVDLDVADPKIDALYRRDSGPIEALAAGPDGPDPDPVSIDRRLKKMLDPIPDEVWLRAVMVDGRAPDIVEDLNGNGRFDARDLRLAGYKVISNQVIHRIATVTTNLTQNTNCVFGGDPRNPWFYLQDLDHNGNAGAETECASSGRVGARSRR